MTKFQQIFASLFSFIVLMGLGTLGETVAVQPVAAATSRASLYDKEILRKIMKHVVTRECDRSRALKKLKNVHSKKSFDKWVEKVKSGARVRRKEYSYIVKPVADKIMDHVQKAVDRPKTEFELKGDGTILMTGVGLVPNIGEFGRAYDIRAGKEPRPIGRLRLVVKISEKELFQMVEEGLRVQGGLSRAIDHWRQRNETTARIASIHGVS